MDADVSTSGVLSTGLPGFTDSRIAILPPGPSWRLQLDESWTVEEDDG
jgi:hypothetical protein